MILFISGSFPYAPDGISDGAKFLLDAMIHNSNKDIFLLLTTEREDIKECLVKDNKYNYVLMKNWKLRFSNIRKFFEILNINENINVIHMEYPGIYYGKTFFASVIPLLLKLYNIRTCLASF